MMKNKERHFGWIVLVLVLMLALMRVIPAAMFVGGGTAKTMVTAIIYVATLFAIIVVAAGPRTGGHRS